MLLTPLPLSQTVTPRTPSPLERDVLYGRPLNGCRRKCAAYSDDQERVNNYKKILNTEYKFATL